MVRVDARSRTGDPRSRNTGKNEEGDGVLFESRDTCECAMLVTDFVSCTSLEAYVVLGSQIGRWICRWHVVEGFNQAATAARLYNEQC